MATNFWPSVQNIRRWLWLGKANSPLNLIPPYIKERKEVSLKHLGDTKAFIEYLNDMKDYCSSIEE